MTQEYTQEDINEAFEVSKKNGYTLEKEDFMRDILGIELQIPVVEIKTVTVKTKLQIHKFAKVIVTKNDHQFVDLKKLEDFAFSIQSKKQIPILDFPNRFFDKNIEFYQVRQLFLKELKKEDQHHFKSVVFPLMIKYCQLKSIQLTY